MPTAAIVVWSLTLLVVALVIVPLAISLLRRTSTAAWQIENYLSDMKDAGVKIAEHTSAIPALDTTLAEIRSMQPVSEEIDTKTSVVATLLSNRAGIVPNKAQSDTPHIDLNNNRGRH